MVRSVGLHPLASRAYLREGGGRAAGEHAPNGHTVIAGNMCILKFLYMYFMHVNVSGRSVLLFNK